MMKTQTIVPALALLLVSVPAFAIDPKTQAEANAANERGVKLLDEGKYEAAAAAFLEAYGKSAHPSELYNAGRSMKEAGQCQRAWKYLRMYEALPETERVQAADREQAAAAARECEAQLCTIEVQGAQSAKLDGEGIAGGRIAVEPGVHTVVMQGNRGEKTAKLSCAANEVRTVRYEEPSTGAQPALPPPSTERSEAVPGRWVVFGVAAGVGAALLGTGAVTAAMSAGAGSAEATDSPADRDDARSRANSLRTVSMITTYAGIGALVVAAVPLVWWPKRQVQARGFSVTPMVGGTSVGLSGSF